MPRTKLKKGPITTKRNRNSRTEELIAVAESELDGELNNMMQDFDFQLKQKWKRIQDHLKSLKTKLSPQVLSLTIGELTELTTQGIKTYTDAQEYLTKSSVLQNITNQTLNSIHQSTKASRTDDGYITGDSVRSDTSKSSRQIGPFQSAKAKTKRRSRSVNSALQKYTKTAPPTQQILRRTKSRDSRSRDRTPCRVQTLSADRTGYVTPKVEAGQSMAMLRYARQGETVISLGGSPVVATAATLVGNQANLNIPVKNGILSIQPSHNGYVDADIVSQITGSTLEQLRAINSNIASILRAQEKINSARP